MGYFVRALMIKSLGGANLDQARKSAGHERHDDGGRPGSHDLGEWVREYEGHEEDDHPEQGHDKAESAPPLPCAPKPAEHEHDAADPDHARRPSHRESDDQGGRGDERDPKAHAGRLARDASGVYLGFLDAGLQRSHCRGQLAIPMPRTHAPHH